MKKARLEPELAQTGKSLGIDFGRSKIGLAWAENETKIAFVLDVWKNDENFWSKLKNFCQQEVIGRIIVGWPFGQNNPNQKVEDISRLEKFLEKVEQETGILVERENEMFTTRMAQNNLRERGDKKISQKDDGESARIILQSWLDRH